MTAPHIVDPSGLLGEALPETSVAAPSAAASSAATPSGQVHDFQAQSVPSRDGVRVALPKKLTDAMGADAAKLPCFHQGRAGRRARRG